MIRNILDRIKRSEKTQVFRSKYLTNKNLVVVGFILFLVVFNAFYEKQEELDVVAQAEEIEKDLCFTEINQENFFECFGKEKNEFQGSKTFYVFYDGQVIESEFELEKGMAKIKPDFSLDGLACIADQSSFYLEPGVFFVDPNRVEVVCLYEEEKKAIVFFQDKKKGYQEVFGQIWGQKLDKMGNVLNEKYKFYYKVDKSGKALERVK